MNRIIDLAHQASITVAAALAKANGRKNTTALDIITDSKEILDLGFLKVLDDEVNEKTLADLERYKNSLIAAIDLASTRTSGQRTLPDAIIAAADVLFKEISTQADNYEKGQKLFLSTPDHESGGAVVSEFEIRPVRFEEDQSYSGPEAAAHPQAWGVYQRTEEGPQLHVIDFRLDSKSQAQDFVNFLMEYTTSSQKGEIDVEAAMTDYLRTVDDKIDIAKRIFLWPENGHGLDEYHFCIEGRRPSYDWDEMPIGYGVPVFVGKDGLWSQADFLTLVRLTDPNCKTYDENHTGAELMTEYIAYRARAVYDRCVKTVTTSQPLQPAEALERLRLEAEIAAQNAQPPGPQVQTRRMPDAEYVLRSIVGPFPVTEKVDVPPIRIPRPQ